MKLIKMLGLAATAAVAATVLFGVNSASAVHLVVLCLEDPAGLCPVGELKASGAGLPILGDLEPLGTPPEKHAVFLGTLKVLCETAHFKGLITRSSPLHGEITEAEIAACEPCSQIIVLNLPYLVKFHHDLTGAHLWLMLVEQNSPTKPILIDIKVCLSGMECQYKTEKLHLDVTNTASGLPLVLSLQNVLTYESGNKLFCGAEGKFDANFLVEAQHSEKEEKVWLALDEKEIP